MTFYECTLKKSKQSLQNHHNIARSLLKEPKFYFYDIARVKEFGPRLENLVACSLIKALHYLEDSKGIECALHYLRTKDGIEADFLIVIDNEPKLAIEVKTKDNALAKGLKHFRQFLPQTKFLQLVYDLDKEYDTPEGIQVRKLSNFLAEFSPELFVQD